MSLTCSSPTQPQDSQADARRYISASRLNLWLRCPLAFKLRYIDGIVSKPTPSQFLGKVVHHGLECYYRHRQLGVELTAADVVAFTTNSWEALAADEEVEFDSSETESRLKTDAENLLKTYLLQRSGDEGRPLLVETSLEAPLIDPFSGENLGVPLFGIVDLVIEGNSGPVICDFKTSAKSNMPHEIMHEIQLSAYAYLFRSLSGTKEESLEIRTLVKTKTPKIDTHRYSARSENQFHRFFDLVRAYLDDLHSGRFLFRPGWTCMMCDYRDGPCRDALTG